MFSFYEILVFLLIWNFEISNCHYLNSWIYRQFQESSSEGGIAVCFYGFYGILRISSHYIFRESTTLVMFSGRMRERV